MVIDLLHAIDDAYLFAHRGTFSHHRVEAITVEIAERMVAHNPQESIVVDVRRRESAGGETLLNGVESRHLSKRRNNGEKVHQKQCYSLFKR